MMRETGIKVLSQRKWFCEVVSESIVQGWKPLCAGNGNVTSSGCFFNIPLFLALLLKPSILKHFLPLLIFVDTLAIKVLNWSIETTDMIEVCRFVQADVRQTFSKVHNVLRSLLTFISSCCHRSTKAS